MSRCAESEVRSHDLSLCPQPIIGSGHSFLDADEFRNASYTMSLVGNFNKNSKITLQSKYLCVVQWMGALGECTCRCELERAYMYL